MTKRIAKSESPAVAGTPRPKRASATHSRKSPAPTAAESSAFPASVPDREVIARLAYSYWEARGCTGGSPEDDWFRAEQELLRKQ
jgi:hypothetical protein